MPSVAIRITYNTADGEERDEEWQSIERFRSWALAEGMTVSFNAYQENEDGEWMVVSKGRLKGPGHEQ